MERHEAFKIATDAKNEAAQLLKWVRAERMIGKEARTAVERARDLLHTACTEFEEGEAHTTHEDLYLPLFDALSFVTGLLNGCDWRRWHDTWRAFVLTNAGNAIDCLEGMNRCTPAY